MPNGGSRRNGISSHVSAYFPHIILCFHLHYGVLCLTNVNVNAPLTQLYGFCKVTSEAKSCHVIYRFVKSHTCTNDPNLTALSDSKCLFFVIAYPCIQVAGFGAIIDWYFNMLGRFFCLHIVKSTSYD